MPDSLRGTATLLRLGLRRDRWLLPGWAVGFAAMAGFSASATARLYPDVPGRVEAVNLINNTPSIVALYGRIYDATSLGALALFKLTAFGAAMVAVLMVFVMVRHTRAEEESGRLELLGAGEVGQAAPMAAALVIVVLGSILLGLLTAVALVVGGLEVAGSLAFGLAWAAAGIVFGGVAAVTAQITTSARAAIGLGMIVAAASYVLRALGDMTSQGPTFLSWLSPIGWSQQVRAFAGNRWWVLLLPVTVAVLLVVVAFVLRTRRDLGGGMLGDRPGPGVGRLRGVWDLALRLQRGVLTAWAVAFVGFGMLLGSVASNVSAMLSSAAMQDFITALGGRQGLVDAFIAAELAIMGMIATAFGLVAASHLRGEETAGRAEPVLAAAPTRSRWATSHVAVALGGVTLLMALAGLAVGLGHLLDVGDAGPVGGIVGGALARVPAAWVLTGLVVAVYGWAPRLTGLVWGVFVAFLAIGELGPLWDAPQWLMDLSPFVHSPTYPLAAGAIRPLVVLTAIAGVLTVVGYVGWNRRDLAP